MSSKYYSFEDYLPHHKLDRVIGAPTTRTLQTVFRQLRRNARSVTTFLGGGQHVHLFLVMTANEWNALPDSIKCAINISSFKHNLHRHLSLKQF